ncbi:hypothetical protein Acsp07_13300 [Actinomycetospora sp. NBRC 106378]|nr:hypothetical protein Acsp07_13300 [Actinomycetospora sp. NBRC 106378]
MARRVGRSKSTLAEAVGGRHLPRWDTVVDFVRACDGDPAEWRPLWERVRTELAEMAPQAVDPDPDAGAEVETPPEPLVEPVVEPEPVVVEPESAVEPVAPMAPEAESEADVEPEVEAAPAPAEPVVLPQPRRRRAMLLAAVVVLCALVGVAGFVLGRWSDLGPQGPAVRAIEVQNKVALGPDRLVEDRTPAYLSTIPISYCAVTDRSCKVPGTEMQSGAGLVAHCVVHGQELHNYNLDEVAAWSNPDRSDSDLWYRASFPDGRIGYISEVYLTSSSRGGLGLADCAPGASVDRAGGAG